MIFLQNVTSQLRITAMEGPQELAGQAWDGMWDILLLGALHHCEAMCNFQSTAPVETLNEKSRLEITNYGLRGLSPYPPRALREEEAVWLESNFEHAQRLLEEPAFLTAMHCLATYRWHSVQRAQLALVWSGIEGLFNVDNEIVFRLSLYIARFLAPSDRSRQIELFNQVKRLYKFRSQAVHGSKIKGGAGSEVEESAELLLSLIRGCVANQALPQLDALAP